MCGLFGIASTGLLSTKEKDFFETLGKLSTSRGRDSTGVFQMKLIKFPTQTEKDSGYKFYYHSVKDTCEPSYFFNRKEWKQSRVDGNHVFMGHNRHATVGDITKAAAHPFVIKGAEDKFLLAGMHNGTLSDYVDKNGEHHSDSHKLYTRIAEIGLKKALEELKEKSAYALAYADGNAQPTFFRNSKRTLYFGMNKGKNTVVWASEERFIKAADAMHDLGIEGITLMATNQLIRLDLSTHEVKFVVAKDYLKKEVIELHEKDYIPYNYSGHNYNGVGYGMNRAARRGWTSFDGWSGIDDDYDSEEEAWARNKLGTSIPIPQTTYQKGIATVKNLVFNHERGYLCVEKTYTRNPGVTTSAYIYKGNAEYIPLMHMWEEEEHKRLGIPYLSMNSKDEIIVSLNSSKKRDKKKIITKGHHNYVGWLDLFEQQEQAFEDWANAETNKRCLFKDRFDKRVMHFNNMSKEAAQVSRIYKEMEREKKALAEKKAKEAAEEKASPVISLPNFVTQVPALPAPKPSSTPPWDEKISAAKSVQREVRESLDAMFQERQGTAWMDGLYYDTGFSSDTIDLANDKLSKGCHSCGNPQVIQDPIHWINSGQFVCNSCFNKDETKQSLPQVNSAIVGKIFRRQ